MIETKNILVVDDYPEILRMVTTYLTGEEYGVETASNGTRMGEILKAHAIDLVILPNPETSHSPPGRRLTLFGLS